MLIVMHSGTVMKRYMLPAEATFESVAQDIWLANKELIENGAEEGPATLITACSSLYMLMHPKADRDETSDYILDISAFQPSLHMDIGPRVFGGDGSPKMSKSKLVIAEMGA